MSEPPSPELRAFAARLFAAGRTERPGPALGRRLALIDPRLAPQHMPAAASSASTARSATRAASVRVSRSSLAKGVALAALVASVAGVWIASWVDADAVSISPERVSHRSRSVLPVTTSPAVAAQPVVSARAPLAPENAVVEAPRSSSVASPAGGAAADIAAPLGKTTAAPLGKTTAAPARLPRHGSKPAESAAQRALVPAAAGSRAPAPDSSSVTPPSTGAQQPLTLLGELDLLKRARAALRSGQPRDALQLLEAHGRDRGGSELVAEATLLRIEALAALGERTAASDLAARFVRENPHSALSDRAKSFILVGARRAP